MRSIMFAIIGVVTSLVNLAQGQIIDIASQSKELCTNTEITLKAVLEKTSIRSKDSVFEWSYRRTDKTPAAQWRKISSSNDSCVFVAINPGAVDFLCKLTNAQGGTMEFKKNLVFKKYSYDLTPGITQTPFKVGTRVVLKDKDKRTEGLVCNCEQDGWIKLLELHSDEPVAIKMSTNAEIVEVTSKFDRESTKKYWDKACSIMDTLYETRAASDYKFPEEDQMKAKALEKAHEELKILHLSDPGDVDTQAKLAVKELFLSINYHTYGEGNSASLSTLIKGLTYYDNAGGAFEEGMKLGDTSTNIKARALIVHNRARVALNRVYDIYLRRIQMPAVAIKKEL